MCIYIGNSYCSSVDCGVPYYVLCSSLILVLGVEDLEFRCFDVVLGTWCIASRYNSYISSVKASDPVGYWN
jgi:hypothetical protein